VRRRDLDVDVVQVQLVEAREVDQVRGNLRDSPERESVGSACCLQRAQEGKGLRGGARGYHGERRVREVDPLERRHLSPGPALSARATAARHAP